VLIFALFNAVCFISPNVVTHAGTVYTKLDGAFWAGYIFITCAFVGMLISMFYAFKAGSLQRLFYNIPLIRIGYAGLIVMLIVGGSAMAIPNLPFWVGIIVCALVLIFTDVALVKADTAAEVVEDIDNKVKAQTAFVKQLTVEAEGLMNSAKSDAVKTACKKVYEAVRYSDPMSNEALAVIEAKITVKIDEFKSAVAADDAEKAVALSDEVILLVKERNAKCKAMK